MLSHLFICVLFYTTGSLESVCETFTYLNDLPREEPVHKKFMEKFPDNTNKGTPLQRDSCSFPFFGNIGLPLMATLYIPGLNMGLLVWLGTIPNVLNAIYTSQLRTLFHGHHVDVPSSTTSSPPPFTFYGESMATSNQKYKRNRKRKNKKNKSPTSMSHVGDRSSTYVSHVEGQRPSSVSDAGEKRVVTTSHTSNRFVSSVSHVIDQSPISTSHVVYVQPTTTIHDGGMNLVPVSHTGVSQPMSASHVGELSTTSASHVEENQPSIAIHVVGIDSFEKPK
jgi:hypothetical protein